MKHTLKRFVSIFILLLFILPYIGLFTWHHYQTYQFKKEFKKKLIKGLNKQELTLIKLSKSEINDKLEWQHSKEFSYKGEMYDVVSSTSTPDSIYYYCWWDNEETVLNKKLNTLLSKLSEKHLFQRKKCKSLITFIKSLYHEEILELKLSYNNYYICHSKKQLYYKSPVILTYAPPPKFL